MSDFFDTNSGTDWREPLADLSDQAQQGVRDYEPPELLTDGYEDNFDENSAWGDHLQADGTPDGDWYDLGDGEPVFLTDDQALALALYEQYGRDGAREILAAARDEAMQNEAYIEAKADAVLAHFANDEGENVYELVPEHRHDFVSTLPPEQQYQFAALPDEQQQQIVYDAERGDLEAANPDVKLGDDFDEFVYNADGDMLKAFSAYKASGKAQRPTLDDAIGELHSVTSGAKANSPDMFDKIAADIGGGF